MDPRWLLTAQFILLSDKRSGATRGRERKRRMAGVAASALSGAFFFTGRGGGVGNLPLGRGKAPTGPTAKSPTA